MSYQITPNNTIVRLEDGAFIPRDEANPAYRTYLEWLEAGGVHEPFVYPTPIDGIQDLSEAKQIAVDVVRQRAYLFLQPTDWVVVREMETGVAAPEAIGLYRAAVREASASKVSTIEGKQKLSTLQDYLRSDEFATWPEPPSA